MTNKRINHSQDCVKPRNTHPMAPMSSDARKMTFLRPFVSEAVPRIGPRTATMMVAAEVA